MSYGKSSVLAPTKEEKLKFMEQEKENSVRIKSYRCQIKSMLLRKRVYGLLFITENK